MLAIDEKCLRLNSMSLLPSFPALDRADNDEFCWTLTVWQGLSVCNFLVRGALSVAAYIVI